MEFSVARDSALQSSRSSLASGSGRVTRIEHELRERGARKLADVFMFPVLDSGRRQWCRYGAVTRVRWRESEQDFYLRGGAVPFDIVPVRPTDPGRAGCWYSLGPGLGDSGELSDCLLLLQVEGDSEQVTRIAGELRAQVSEQLQLLEDGAAKVPGQQDWRRYCLSAVPKSD
jgi:hypothetical protein